MITNRRAQKHRNHFLLVLVSFSFVFSPVAGQESNTLYFMKGVPQAYQINPAAQPECRFFLGFPAVSPLQVFTENSAYSLKDIVFPLGDSLVTFMHPEADKNEFLDNLAPVNTLQAYESANLFSVGYQMDNSYYTFDLSQKTYTRFIYNDDVLNFLLTGNKRGDQFDFSNTNVDFTTYLEAATGNFRKINDRLTVGSRIKILFGEANVSTVNKDLSLITGEDWTIRSDIKIRLSVPGLNIPVNENGEISLDSIEFDPTLTSTEIMQAAFGNIGLGIDLGLHYKLTDKIMLSGSLLDLAGIRWSANTYTFSQNASYVYKGIEINPSDTAGATENFFDSLSTVFRFVTTLDPYYTMLPLKLYVGGTVQVIDQIGFGILSRTEYYKNRLREQLTLSANFSPLRIFTFSLSYTLFNNSYNNFGFGFSARFGPFNMYLISDNISTHYIVDNSTHMVLPYNNRVMNLRVGLNLVFGCLTEKKKASDLPLVL
jgi:hypothetical protein